ncbi:MAG: BamA/TamA family outer membrane protein [Candidatus Neomarinimicrobiota bacterium]
MMNKPRFLTILLIGLTATGFTKDENIPIINNIEIIGGISISMNDIQAVLKMKKPVLFSKMTFDRRIMKLDAISVKTLFISKGFLSVTVKDSFKINNEQVDVFFIINEGKQYHIKSEIVAGNTALNDQDVLKILGLKQGNPYNPVGINTNRSYLEESYHELGYLFCSFTISDSIADSVAVRVSIIEGPKVKINNISWKGLEGLNPEFITRELAFKTGDVYRKSAMDLSQQRLLRTGLFSGAFFIPLVPQGTDSLVNILIELRHFKPYEWVSEGGFYPIGYLGGPPVPGAGADIEWRSRRIFNTSTSFAVKLSSEVGLLRLREIPPKIRSEVNLSNQWLFGFRIPTELGLYYEYLKDYLQPKNPLVERRGIRFANTFKFSERSFIQLSFRWEKFSGLEDASESLKSKIEQRSFNVNLFLDHSDHPLYPTEGVIYSLLAKGTGGILGGERHYYKLDIGIRRYKSIGNFVLAGRLKAGGIKGWDKKYTDVNRDLFYLGGSTSLRGWDYGRFPNPTEDDEPIGDEIRLLINSELRFPLIWNFGGEIFVDGGSLTDNFNELNMNSIKWDVGIGITLRTALGPVRLDYAIPVGGNINKDLRGERKTQLGIHYIF